MTTSGIVSGMSVWLQWVLRGMTVLGWVTAALFAVPAIDAHVSAGQNAFTVAVAIAGTLALVVVHCQAPAESVWQAGREHGRREARREASSRNGKVVHLTARREA